MLETVLKIGKALRGSPSGLKHHRYIKPCPKDSETRKILRLTLPLKNSFQFDFERIEEIKDENIIKDKLFYPTFKTSEADGLVKYIFGDIYYSLSKGKEVGYYRLEDKSNKQKAYRVSSFFRGTADFKSIEKIYEKQTPVDCQKESFLITLFRKEFEKNIVFIEMLFKYQCGIVEFLGSKRNGGPSVFIELLSNEKELRLLTAKNVFFTIKQSRAAKKIFKKIINNDAPQWEHIEADETQIESLINYSTGDLFLHFDFNEKQWYEFADEFNIINSKMLEDFAEKLFKGDGYMLKKYLYKTLSSPEKDLQFPTFHAQARYRSKLFKNIDEISDLLYAINYSKMALIKILYTDIKIVVLPRGINLKASHYERFVQSGNSLRVEQEQEMIIGEENSIMHEQLFDPLVENVSDNIIKFDLIFSKQGGQKAPDIDLVEVSGVEKSHLREINQRIGKIKRDVYDKRENEINVKLKPINITWSFLNILRDSTSDIKKYQNHLYKVLPQIYTGTYYNDAILLPAIIEKTELNIRNGKHDFNLLKYDFYFLLMIRNTIPEGGELMKVHKSQSYKVGLMLGELARQFASWRVDCPIKSFEKSYVGTLSRRITTISDLIRFKTFIEEKLILHGKAPFTHATSVKLAEGIKVLELSSNERYDRHNCAFGFFESYFATSFSK